MTDLDDPRFSLLPSDVLPQVARPPRGLPSAAIFALFGLAAVLLFIVLDGRRRALQAPAVQDSAQAPSGIFQPAPPLDLPQAPPAPVVIAIPRPTPEPPAAVSPPKPTFTPQVYRPPPPPPPYVPSTPPQAFAVQPGTGRLSDSPLVFDATAGGNGAVEPAGGPPGAGAGPGAGAVGVSNDAAHATIIRGRSTLIPQGTLIAAVLETPLNSSRPGLARAIISRDVRGFDGSRVLITRGSRLIGEFRSDASPSQRRVLVTWTRLIRPDGVAISIGSPSTDALGGAGIAGSVNTHFFQRFVNAVLQSALTVGVNIASRPREGSVVIGVPGQLGSVGQSLFPDVNPQPTVKVSAGAEIGILVARDLDFAGASQRQ